MPDYVILQTVVESNSNQNFTVNLNQQAALGSLFVLAIQCQSTVTLVSVTDNGVPARTYYPRLTSPPITVNGFNFYVFDTDPTQTAPTGLSIQLSGPGPSTFILREYGSLAGTFDQEAQNAGAGPSNIATTGTTPVTSYANELVVNLCGSTVPAFPTVGPGYSNYAASTGSSYGIAIQDKEVNRLGTQSGQFENTSANEFAACVLTYVINTNPPPIPLPPVLAGLPFNLGNVLSWQMSLGATSYTLLRSTTQGSGYSPIFTADLLTFTDGPLVNDVTYYYVVTASNSNGTSGYSNEVACTPFNSAGFDTQMDISAIAPALPPTYSFAVRLISPMRWGPGANSTTLLEVNGLHQVKMQIGSLWQNSGDISTFSTQEGSADSGYALVEAQALGIPIGGCIYFSVPFDASSQQIAGPIAQYFAAAQAKLHGVQLTVGVQGSGLVCQSLAALGLVDHTWLVGPTWQEWDTFTGWDLKQGAWTVVQGLGCYLDTRASAFAGGLW